MKILVTFFVISATILSCESIGKYSGSDDKKTIICLLDISGSTKENNLNFFLDNIANEAFDKMDESTSLVILAIDNGSQTAATPLFKMDLSKVDFLDPSLPMTVRDKMAARKKAQFIVELKSSFKQKVLEKIYERQAYATHTDIFGSLKQVERYKTNQTTVMIFSDMLNYSEEFNMERLVKKKVNLMEELNNTPTVTAKSKINIYVSTGDNVNLGPKKYNSIKEFWEEYFTKNGYNLVDYTSGQISI